jgi:predicted Fe-Mo cluster-binding NifX family protein
MRIAVTSQHPDLGSEVDPRFGRAPYFVIVDTDSMDFEVIDNEQNLNAAQGAGIQAAQLVSTHRVEGVLTGHCGPKAFQTLTAAGVSIHSGVSGTVREAVEKFKRGDLKALTAPDVEGHW